MPSTNNVPWPRIKVLAPVVQPEQSIVEFSEVNAGIAGFVLFVITVPAASPDEVVALSQALITSAPAAINKANLYFTS